MLSSGMKVFTDTPLTVIGMILFLFAFAMVVMWTFRKNGKKFYSKVEKLPLEDDEVTS
jgi:cbb3-type cytochrome oxidase subunit 3